VEADESDGTFLDLETEIAVVTSVEPEHLEH
jgi:UDP-N-acetylmuramate-alanine ligase